VVSTSLLPPYRSTHAVRCARGEHAALPRYYTHETGVTIPHTAPSTVSLAHYASTRPPGGARSGGRIYFCRSPIPVAGDRIVPSLLGFFLSSLLLLGTTAPAASAPLPCDDTFRVGPGRPFATIQAAVDALLRAKWTGVKDFLRSGDIDGALESVVLSARDSYRDLLTALTVPLSTIDVVLTDISFVSLDVGRVEYQMIQVDDGVRLSYFILFARDADGIWRLRFF